LPETDEITVKAPDKSPILRFEIVDTEHGLLEEEHQPEIRNSVLSHDIKSIHSLTLELLNNSKTTNNKKIDYDFTEKNKNIKSVKNGDVPLPPLKLPVEMNLTTSD
jgi:hypothetical protein